ncbi:hypothetical protein FW754_12600 [Acinetobacter sp. 1207_04]|uniref:ThiF family adenylyltransferase n=1 Tax=Acinetobacter sp. 1207_04 TaxID=2604449 RepID=UPI004059A1DC
MKTSEIKQRVLYFDRVDQYLAELGLSMNYLPEPNNSIFPNITKKSIIVDSWVGSLNFDISKNYKIKVELLIQVVDWNFLTLPKIYLKGPLSKELEKLIGLAHFFPMPYYIPLEGHTDYYLNICYSLHSEISLPRHYPEVLMEWVIKQCHKLFEESLLNTFVRDADIKRDLDIMWHQLGIILYGSEIDFSINKSADINLLIDRIEDQVKKGENIDLGGQKDQELLHRFRSVSLNSQSYIHRIEPSQTKLVLYKRPAQWESKDKQVINNYLTRFFVINTDGETNVLPSLEIFSKRIFNYQKELHSNRDNVYLYSGPILRLIDLIFWLKVWNKSTLKIWKDIFFDLFASDEILTNRELYFCLIIDTTPLAFCITFPESLKKITSYKIISSEINKLRNLDFLTDNCSINILSKIGIIPLSSQNLTGNYIFNRNLKGMKQENLSARTIVVIGVGAVGGYLTHSLARLGAGSEGGELILIDEDSLSESNVGRHILGENYISKSKVEALKEQLKLELPQLNVKVYNIGVENFLNTKSNKFDLSQADIIFDATAKAGIGELLSEWRRGLVFPQPCFIHVWIRDNGECVQALLNAPTKDLKPQFACRSCLQIAGGKFLPQYDALPNHEPTVAYAACSDFTPYAVSASMSAASLATDMVLDYVNDKSSPRYRTRYTERWSGAKLESADVAVALDCPYCSGI